jgi:acyl-coenzyme A thioesterase PaaI-like protein
VPFTGTARIVFEEVTAERVVLRLENRRTVQNHIRGVHATASALLGETATGFALGLHLPDQKLPLLRSMKIDYTRRAQGGLRAEAYITAEQREALEREPKGEVTVAVKVTDETGAAPMECEYVWAWVPKKR